MVVKAGLRFLRRGKSAPRPQWEKEGGIKGELTGADMSTSDEASLESMEPVCEQRGGNFPLRITEFIHQSHCEVVPDGTSTVGAATVWEHGGVLDDLEAESRGIEIFDQTLARTGRASIDPTQAQQLGGARTSVDCQLDDIVLTMDRENIFNELSYLCKPMAGKWETCLEYSDPLDPLFKQLGIGYMKRFVVDKLALQIAMDFTPNRSCFQLDLAIPFGNRTMKWDLHGRSVQDNDPDCGIWDGHVDLVKFDLGEICPKGSKSYDTMQQIIAELPEGHSKTLYAACQIRSHETIGVVHETRFSLPSKQHGKLLFLKYILYPKKNSTPVVIMRCCKALRDDTVISA